MTKLCPAPGGRRGGAPTSAADAQGPGSAGSVRRVSEMRVALSHCRKSSLWAARASVSESAAGAF
eukprot:2746587-Alexandrium_andersonii.AAC.1